MNFQIVLFAGAIISGAISVVAGFGVGTVLNPLLAAAVGTPLAVAAVSIPHFFATALRAWRLRSHIDRQVLLRFAIPGAVGGLVGILLHNAAANRVNLIVVGILAIFLGVSALDGLPRYTRFNDTRAWIYGAIAGFYGGLVRHQGGLRSAALLGFDISKKSFLAAAAASWLIVDAVRMPVYLITQGAQIAGISTLVIVATVGALIGTVIGEMLLPYIQQSVFRRVAAGFVVAVGLYMCLFAKP
jgi:uncharacterized protein